MSTWVGARIVDMLESAGRRYLKPSDPDLYRAFLLHVSGTDLLRRYDGSEVYWQRVQAILDTFFGADERAVICARMIEQHALRRLPEFRSFLARATAECRLQELVAGLAPSWSRAVQASGPRRV